MTDKIDSSNHRFLKVIEEEDKQDAITIREDFKIGLDQIVAGVIHLEECQGIDKSIEVGQGMTQIIEEIIKTIWEIIKGMEDKIIAEIALGAILEIKAMTEVGVGQMIGNLDIMREGTTEVLGTVDQGQVLEWIPIEIELDVSNVDSMIISQETSWQCK